MSVYFIQNERTLSVKIGHAQDAKGRLQTLQVGSSDRLYLLLEFQGCGRLIEKMLHERFRASRIRGEWFDVKHGSLHWFVRLAIRGDRSLLECLDLCDAPATVLALENEALSQW